LEITEALAPTLSEVGASEVEVGDKQMELTDEEAENRLNREDNLVNMLVQHRTMHENQGRKPGDVAIPKELKALIALTADESTQKEIAEEFGVSQMTVSNIKNGKASEGRSDEKLIDIAEQRRKTSSEKALDNLMDLLGRVPEAAKTATKLRDISAAAKDMAAVHEKVSGRHGSGQDVKVLIYAPRLASERDYGVIEVEAQIID